VASSAPDRLDHEVVDVFAPSPSGGNQVAVVLDAGPRTTAQGRPPAATVRLGRAPAGVLRQHRGTDVARPEVHPDARDRAVPDPVAPRALLPDPQGGRVTVAAGAATRAGVAGAVRPAAAGTIRVPAC
jgi:hypothetical protein